MKKLYVLLTISASMMLVPAVASAQQARVVVPTMNEWGMIIFMVLAGVGSIAFLRKRTARD